MPTIETVTVAVSGVLTESSLSIAFQAMPLSAAAVRNGGEKVRMPQALIRTPIGRVHKSTEG